MRNRIDISFAAWVSTAVLGIILANSVVRAAGFVTPEEMQYKEQWAKENLLDLKARMPFSFTYGRQPSDELLMAWPKKDEKKQLDQNRTQYTTTWVDTKTGLEMKCVAVDYNDFPAIEWTVYFKNTGKENSPTLKKIQGLDTTFRRDNTGEFVLNGIKGDWTTADSYEPYQITLDANTVKTFAPLAGSGKSSSGPEGWPYYNLRMPGGGVLMAVGWPGQWASSFTRNASTGLRVKAGQELTNLYLKPGEEIRTPLIAMVFWRGTDTVRSQNLWRRWYLAHTLPRIDGSPQAPVTHIAAMEIPVADSYLQAGVKPDICWQDANWYPSGNGPYKGGEAWLNTGTWEIDRQRFPEGFRPFTDWIHAKGMKFLLWFEPERVGDPNSWLGKNHPEWLLPGESHGSLLDEGNPAAWRWLVNHVDGMIKSQGIDWYREDMNGQGPLLCWRKNDANDRQGITENLYVQGHLAFWDELKRRNPRLRIDSCASGGRRNDLETMRRAVPLTRSDFLFRTMEGVVEGNQGHTYGLSFWLPFQGSGCFFYDAYSFRSFYLSSFGMAEGIGGENTASQKKAYSECRKIATYMLHGDYYPLTPYSLKLDQWIGWQFDRPELGAGVVQAFRRGECQDASKTLRLNGLDPAAKYTVTNFDVETTTNVSGQELMEKGLTVEIKDKPGAAVISYKKID